MTDSDFITHFESEQKHINVELVNTTKRMQKLSAKPNFHAFKIFNEDLAAVHMKKVKLLLNRPIYVGFTILDLSKIVMYDFHYNHIKPKYGEKVQLLFTDTDSLCYEIETEDLYRDMENNKEHYDFSAYPKEHFLYDITNKKVLGKMKDETNSVPPEGFVVLRAKMYTLKYGSSGKKTAKGVKKLVIQKAIQHDMYRDCLFQRMPPEKCDDNVQIRKS